MPNYLIALIPIALIALWFGLGVVDARYLKLPRNLRQLRNKLPGAATWTVLLFALICGVLALFFGWLGYNEATKEEFYVNLSTSLGSIAITVLVIDQLNRWRIASERKREIIEQMGSQVHDAAGEAVRIARNMGMLTDGSLRGAKLSRADLIKAPLKRAHLGGAHLEDAHLGGAHLEDAHLERARLEGVHLEDAHLERAHLERAHLGGAHLERAHLQGAHLQGADLTFAHLEGARLGWPYLGRPYLEDVDLEDAKLEDAYFEDAELEVAEAEVAYLELVYQKFARRAGIQVAPPEGAHLEGADLMGATYDNNTTWRGARYKIGRASGRERV